MEGKKVEGDREVLGEVEEGLRVDEGIDGWGKLSVKVKNSKEKRRDAVESLTELARDD